MEHFPRLCCPPVASQGTIPPCPAVGSSEELAWWPIPRLARRHAVVALARSDQRGSAVARRPLPAPPERSLPRLERVPGAPPRPRTRRGRVLLLAGSAPASARPALPRRGSSLPARSSPCSPPPPPPPPPPLRASAAAVVAAAAAAPAAGRDGGGAPPPPCRGAAKGCGALREEGFSASSRPRCWWRWFAAPRGRVADGLTGSGPGAGWRAVCAPGAGGRAAA